MFELQKKDKLKYPKMNRTACKIEVKARADKIEKNFRFQCTCKDVLNVRQAKTSGRLYFFTNVTNIKRKHYKS